MGGESSKGCVVAVDLGVVSMPVSLSHPVDFRALQTHIRARSGIPELHQIVTRIRDGARVQMSASDAASLHVRRGDSISVSWRRVGGRHPLHLAAADGNVAALNLWLSAGSQVDVRDDDGRTPLISAAQSGRATSLETLLAAGADVDAVTLAGWSALHWAAYWRQEAACRVLCAAGASARLAGRDGETPLQLAGREPNVEAILRAAGATSQLSIPSQPAAGASSTSLPGSGVLSSMSLPRAPAALQAYMFVQSPTAAAASPSSPSPPRPPRAALDSATLSTLSLPRQPPSAAGSTTSLPRPSAAAAAAQ